MIRIGFDDDNSELYDESLEPKINHGDKFEFERKTDVYIPQRRIEEMKKEFDCVVVHEYGDEYHLTEEERRAKNRFYEAFKIFRKCKHNYRKLDEYVSAMREALKCLEFVANENGVYDPEEFKKLFLKGKIFVNGLKFPKFKGREKKDISWDYLTEFILSDADPIEILPKKHEEELITEEDFRIHETLLFDKDELEKILTPLPEEDQKEQLKFFDVDEDKQDGKNKNVVVFLDRKGTKKIMKSQPELLYTLKEAKRQNRSIDNLDRLAYDLTSDDIEEISANDQRYHYSSKSDMPEFKGDIMNDKDFYKYFDSLEEFEDTQIKENYAGKLKTKEQIRELELKKQLESDGWNMRNLYDNQEKEARLKKAAKRDKKRERELKKKLISVQNRRKRKIGDSDDIEKSSAKSGKKKDKKKKKKSSKDDIKHQKKERNQYKKEQSDTIDEFLLNSAERTDHDFDEWKDDAMDWSFDNIMKG